MSRRIGLLFWIAVVLGTLAQAQDFHEGWESATPGVYTPGSIIEGDEGAWFVGDTISQDPTCGTSPQRAEILAENSNQVLQLRSVQSFSGCPDSVWAILTQFDSANPGFGIPIAPNTIISFNELGELDDAQAREQNCFLPPCFDNISLILADNNGNILVYVLQRFFGAVANASTQNFGDTYREIFLNPTAGSYRRDVFADFLAIPNFDPTDAQITLIEFRVDQHGTGMIDDLVIGPQAPTGTEPVYRFFAPIVGSHFFTASETEALKLINNFSNVWLFEGVGFYALPSASLAGALPVYRFWSPFFTDHFYTISEAEKNKLIDRFSGVWNFEGVAFYAFAAGTRPAETVPVYRFFNRLRTSHFYTASTAERDKLLNFPGIFDFEGIAWYAYPP